MELQLEFNNTRKVARVVFGSERDEDFLPEWRKCLGDDKASARVDAVELAEIAVKRVVAHSGIQPYASSIDEIANHIKHDNNAEVAGFVLFKCDWFPDSPVIGISHFRRTWANNIILDYLAIHPNIVGRPHPNYPHKVRGAGLALLYFICTLAKQLGCNYLWGEATPNSHEYYKKQFGLEAVTDLIHVPITKINTFLNNLDEKWAKEATPTTVKDSSLDRDYDLESKHPPFVGSKTAVFNPRRKLAIRFLDLPAHIQMEIANSLNLREPADPNHPNPELLRQFFTRAADRQLLAQLWTAVEGRHPDGNPDPNPFVSD